MTYLLDILALTGTEAQRIPVHVQMYGTLQVVVLKGCLKNTKVTIITICFVLYVSIAAYTGCIKIHLKVKIMHCTMYKNIILTYLSKDYVS